MFISYLFHLYFCGILNPLNNWRIIKIQISQNFSYAKLKSRNPQTKTTNMASSFISYDATYNKTFTD